MAGLDSSEKARVAPDHINDNEVAPKVPASDTTKAKVALSEAVAPKISAGPGVSTVDRSDVPEGGIPEDGNAIMSMAINFLEEDMKKPDSKVNQSLFLKGIYSGLKMYEGLFGGILFSSEDFIDSVSAMYPKEAFKEDEMNKVWEKRLRVRYAELTKKLFYGEAKTTKEQDADNAERKDIEERLAIFSGATSPSEKVKFKKDLLAQFDTDDKIKAYIEQNKLPLTKEDLAKFSALDNADPYVSTYYVSKQLDLPETAGVELKNTYEPKTLMSKLDHSAYVDHNNNSRQKLFSRVDKLDEFDSLRENGNLPAGTVVFFKKLLPDNTDVLMCGIVDMSGKIKYQTKEELSDLDPFTPGLGNKLSLVDNFKKGTLPDVSVFDEMKGALSSVTDTNANGIRFAGAFMPTTSLGEKDSNDAYAQADAEKAEQKKKKEAEDAKPEGNFADLTAVSDKDDESKPKEQTES